MILSNGFSLVLVLMFNPWSFSFQLFNCFLGCHGYDEKALFFVFNLCFSYILRERVCSSVCIVMCRTIFER